MIPLGSGGGPLLRLALVLSLLAPLVDLDWRVQRAVQEHRTPLLDAVMRGATDLGKPQIVLGTLLAIAVLSGPAGVATARAAFVAAGAANLVVEGLKLAVNRTRPDGERKRSNASFPSGHAATAFALALVFAHRWRRLAPGLWALAAAVAWSRIYLNRHFLSDVLCGVGIGLAASWITMRAIPIEPALRPDADPAEPTGG